MAGGHWVRAAFGALACALSHSAAAADPLNVLFVVVDDLAPTLSTYGFPTVTPHFERLAAESVQFDRSYISVSVCAPSRTAFLTGLRPDATQARGAVCFLVRVHRPMMMVVLFLNHPTNHHPPPTTTTSSACGP